MNERFAAGAEVRHSQEPAAASHEQRCHTLHRHSSATYHHRYGHGAHAFARCVTARNHHQHHDAGDDDDSHHDD